MIKYNDKDILHGSVEKRIQKKFPFYVKLFMSNDHPFVAVFYLNAFFWCSLHNELTDVFVVIIRTKFGS